MSLKRIAATMAGIAVAALAAAPAVASAAPARATSAGDSASCRFIEISAMIGTHDAVSAELKPLASKFTKQPFADWNQYRLRSSAEDTLRKNKAQAINLATGSATATLISVDPKSAVRLAIVLKDAKGAPRVNNTGTVAVGDYILYTYPLNAEMNYVLAITCKPVPPASTH